MPSLTRLAPSPHPTIYLASTYQTLYFASTYPNPLGYMLPSMPHPSPLNNLPTIHLTGIYYTICHARTYPPELTLPTRSSPFTLSALTLSLHLESTYCTRCVCFLAYSFPTTSQIFTLQAPITLPSHCQHIYPLSSC